MDTVQSYLKNRLKTCSHYIPTSKDLDELNQHGVEIYLYRKLSSKKFRRTKLTEHCEVRLRRAISEAISQNKPIQLVFPAGAYKLWKLQLFPEVDWAEFFTLAHILSYLAPVLSSYKPGIQLNYYLFTYLMQRSNNISADEVSKYLESFQMIIDEFLKYTPQNIQIKIITDSYFYERDVYFSMLEANTEKAKEEYNHFPLVKKEKYLKSSRLNIRWKGCEDWTLLNDVQKEDKVFQGALYEVKANAHYFQKIKQWVFDTDKIIVFPQGKDEFIGIGSTKNSIVKYWTGIGVLEKNKNMYEDRILSPSQLETVKSLSYKEYDISLIPLHNLKKIAVFDNPIIFAN